MGFLAKLKDALTSQAPGGAYTKVLPAGSQPGRRTNRGLLAAYGESPWLHAVVSKVATSASSVRFRLYQPKRNDELVEITDHPMLDLLSNGNPYMLGSSVDQLTQMYLDLLGEAFWLLERDGAGTPVEILPIPPTWVTDIATPSTGAYMVDMPGWQGQIPASEMIHFVKPDPMNPYGRGVGTARALHDELLTDEMAAKHTAAFFHNSARPDLIVSGEGLGGDEARRLERKWKADHGGFRNAYSPAFLNGPVNVHEINQSFKDMELTELRQHERDTIIQTFGIPPEMFGILESSNRATIQSAAYLFTEWVLKPRLEYKREMLQVRIAPLFDERIIVGYDSPTEEDKGHQLEVAKAAPWSLTVDEWREMMDLSPLEGGSGEVFMMPFNLVPQERPSLVPDEVSEGRREIATSKVYRPTEDDVSRLVRLLSPGGLLKRLRSVVRDAVQSFGERAVSEVDDEREFDSSGHRVERYLDDFGADRVERINETTRESLKEELIEGVGEGESADEIAARVQGVFDEASTNRAKVIARTEVVTASNFASTEGYRQAGAQGKEWLAARDDRTRSTHRSLDGQKRTLDANFDSPSGASGPYPGMLGSPDEDIQCRCTTLAVLSMEESKDEDARAAMWRAFDRERAPFERRVTDACRKEFRAQERDVLQALEEMSQQEAFVND